MPTPRWAPGTPYPTGSLVQPLTAIAPVPTSLDNPGFDNGTTSGWTFSGGGVTAVTGLNSQSGTYNLGCDNGIVIGVNDENPAASPGLSISASIYVRLSQSGTSAGRVRLWWFDAGNVQIGSPVDGNLVQKPGNQSERWVLSSLSAVAPALTASVKIGFWTNSGVGGGDTRVDSLSWNYTSATAPAGLIYKAVQPTLGISDGTEPVWPLTAGVQVIDNTVIWEAMVANRVVWEASPIMVSGATEPLWPEEVGESITDNTVSWETVSLRVEDENCPNSKVVTIASSKVYAADEDIVRYSATVNPLDWTTPDDAGYLPTGLNQYGSNRTAVLNTYRGNVVSFSASTFQNWQVDPDPANITLLDSMEGIGSTYQQAAHPVANDLFYLSPLGVRTVGISAGTSNLAAGDAGAPIDPLVSAAIVAVPGVRPLGAYYPNQGQYWLCMRPPLPTVVGPTITGSAPDGQSGQAYAQFNYTVTPGDAPIQGTEIIDGTFMDGLGFDEDDAFIEAGIAGAPGTYTFTLETIDTNGLTGQHTDTVVIVATNFATTSGNNLFYTSTAYNWNMNVDVGESVGNSLVESRNGKVFAFHNDDSGASVSSNAGATWAPCTGLPAALKIVALLYTGDEYIAVPQLGTSLYVSTDGIAFAPRAFAADDKQINSGIVVGNTVIIARGNSSQSRRSTNKGVTWADCDLVSSTPIFAIANSATSIVCCTGGVSAFIRRSVDDGVTWSYIANPLPIENLASVAYGNGKYVLVNSSGQVAVSNDDGVTWAASTSLPGSLGTVGEGNEMVFDGVNFVVASATFIYTSPDTVAWTPRTNLSAVAIAFYRGAE